MKRKLKETPVLRYFDFTKPFEIHSDASNVGIRAVLAQRDENNHDYAIAYASRSLNKPERNYTVTERECLAVI